MCVCVCVCVCVLKGFDLDSKSKDMDFGGNLFEKLEAILVNWMCQHWAVCLG